MKAECTEEYPRCILPFSLSVCFPTKIIPSKERVVYVQPNSP